MGFYKEVIIKMSDGGKIRMSIPDEPTRIDMREILVGEERWICVYDDALSKEIYISKEHIASIEIKNKYNKGDKNGLTRLF